MATGQYETPILTPTDGRRVGEKKGWQVTQMWENHHEIARRILLGQSNVDIAASMNIGAAQVSSVRNSPVVKDKIAIMSAARDAGTIDLSKEIMDLAPIAIARVKEALTTGKVFDKEVSATGILKEANNMIDRERGKAVQRVDTRNLHGHFTLSDIDRIKAKAKELAGGSMQMAMEGFDE